MHGGDAANGLFMSILNGVETFFSIFHHSFITFLLNICKISVILVINRIYTNWTCQIVLSNGLLRLRNTSFLFSMRNALIPIHIQTMFTNKVNWLVVYEYEQFWANSMLFMCEKFHCKYPFIWMDGKCLLVQ